MFKKELAKKVNEILNLNSVGLKFELGYNIVFYNGIPNVINTDSVSLFDYSREEVIPVSEEYSQETPYIDLVDRSDYICQYQLTFRLEHLTSVETALEEYRAYVVANREHIIDGYNVSFKVTRGDKQSTWTMDGGNYYGRYKLDVYTTATQGYLSSVADKWEIRQYGVGDYTTLKLINDQAATSYNIIPSSKSTKTTNVASISSYTSMFQMAYSGTTLDKLIYQQCMNKGVNNMKFDIKETFDEVVNEYVVIISSGGRTRKLNEPVFIEFNVVEYE